MSNDKKAVSLIGLSLLAILILLFALQIISGFISDMLSDELLIQIVNYAGISIGTLILVDPITAFMLRKLPVMEAKEQKRVSFANMTSFLIIGVGATCLTSLLRISVAGFRQRFIIPPQEFSAVWLVSGIIAAVAEEILFRRIILNRLKPFGDKEAVFISALAFGLCHMSFWSFLFAFALGLIFGQITVSANTIRYSCILHIANNILMVSLLPFVFNIISETASNAVCIALIILGAVIFIIKRKFILSLCGTDKGVGIKAILKIPSMIIFLVVSVIVALLLYVLFF
jgi:membrane protease YdiL (CAAX protease family)